MFEKIIHTFRMVVSPDYSRRFKQRWNQLEVACSKEEVSSSEIIGIAKSLIDGGAPKKMVAKKISGVDSYRVRDFVIELDKAFADPFAEEAIAYAKEYLKGSSHAQDRARSARECLWYAIKCYNKGAQKPQGFENFCIEVLKKTAWINSIQPG